MVFNKKFIAGLILIGVFTHVGAMKRSSEDVSSPNKRQKVEEGLTVPAAPQKKQSQRIFVRTTGQSPLAGRYTSQMEAAIRKDEIMHAIEAHDFDGTIGLLGRYAADVDNTIIGDVFNSNFSQEEQIQLFKQLRDDQVNVCGYKDPLSDRNIFHICAQNDYADLFSTALRDCPNATELVKATDSKGNTVIHWTHNPAIIAEAVRLGVNINQKNKAGNTALHQAAWLDDEQRMAILVAAGASCNIPDKTGKNIFHIFAEKDNPDLFTAALSHCPNAIASVKATDEDGNTVIHLTDSPAIIADAVRLGVDINQKNNAGNAALHEASGGSSSEKQRAAILVASGASLDILNAQGYNPYERGGARNEGLNPDNPEAVAHETKKVISFGSGPHKKNIFPYIFDRSMGAKTVPGIVRHEQNLWESESSLSGYDSTDDESGSDIDQSDYVDSTTSSED